MAKKQSKAPFDPNAAATADGGVYGLPFSAEESKIVYIPVPWEVTTSYGGGTSRGPQAIREASLQVDLFDLELGNFWEAGLHMIPEPRQVRAWNTRGQKLAAPIIRAGGAIPKKGKLATALEEVNALGLLLNDWVYQETKKQLTAGRIPAIVGGDHAVPFGAFKAACEAHGDIGILHFDAHSDTRKAYEGFTWSHASIMRNALERLPKIKSLVQVGIRDFCEEEMRFIQDQGSRASVYFDEAIMARKFEGEPWQNICDDIVDRLPEKVWVSFDIDGLDPRYCPHTGTPVPGGLDYSQAVYLIKTLAQSGRRIVGFDLNEVAPGPKGNEWDGNVGARLLYKLSGWCLKTWP